MIALLEGVREADEVGKPPDPEKIRGLLSEAGERPKTVLREKSMAVNVPGEDLPDSREQTDDPVKALFDGPPLASVRALLRRAGIEDRTDQEWIVTQLSDLLGKLEVLGADGKDAWREAVRGGGRVGGQTVVEVFETIHAAVLRKLPDGAVEMETHHVREYVG